MAWTDAALPVVVATLLLEGCATAPSRAARGPYACMAAVRDAVPAEIPDARRHCLAAGGIAMRCSRGEARFASWGKEIQDVFTGGDPSRADLAADRAGIACAARVADADALAACCDEAGYPAAPH